MGAPFLLQQIAESQRRDRTRRKSMPVHHCRAEQRQLTLPALPEAQLARQHDRIKAGALPGHPRPV